VQKQAADSCVKKVSYRMPVKIYHENTASRYPAQLAENSNDIGILEMVSKERAQRVIKLTIDKGKVKSVTAKSRNFRKRCRSLGDYLCGTRV